MGEPIKVLLVDDDESIRTLLRYSFGADPRFKVVGEAYDGRSAMRAMEVEKPDVVVLDLVMPLMDGYHAIPQIVMGAPETKILVLTDADVNETELMYKGAHSVRAKNEVLDGYGVMEAAALLCQPT
ncbi:MAG TPA: response regulator [Actinomycetota bacterium]|nr:response regulator [Actinomycetota bacterium]